MTQKIPVRKHRTTWTYRERKLLRAAWERRLAGERTADLALEFDITASALCTRWRRLGFQPEVVLREEQAASVERLAPKVWRWYQQGASWRECVRRIGGGVKRSTLKEAVEAYASKHELALREFFVDDRDAQVYAWRSEGVPFRECAQRLGLEPSRKVQDNLCCSLRRYCNRHGVPYPYGDAVKSSDADLYAWRQEGLTYRQCAERLGVEYNESSRRKLAGRVQRYCKKKALPVPGRATNARRGSDDLGAAPNEGYGTASLAAK